MPASPDRRAARLHASAVGLSAFCLFAAQPIAAQLCLPRLGGTPAVWNGVSLFFQVALLAAYLSAHALARRLRARTLAWTYASTLLLACAVVWLRPPAEALAATRPGDLTSLLVHLGAYLGLPAFALGLSTPLWSHRHAHEGHGDPYWLYAASNLGSFGALLLYPFVLEPALGLARSFDLWRAAMVGLAVLAAVGAWRAPATKAPTRSKATPTIPLARSLTWAALAAIVAAYSLALTVHLSTDLAPAPWLWSLPLAVYLATYVLAFSRHADPLRERVAPLTPLVLAVSVVLIVLEISRPTPGVLAALLIGEFCLGLTLHLELARLRPAPTQSTTFYGWAAAGGMLGALFVTLLSPAISDRNWDLPLLLFVALFVLPADPRARTRRQLEPALASALVLGLSMALLFVARGPTRPEGTVRAFAFALWLPLLWPAFRWPRASARALGLLLLLGVFAFESNSKVIALARSPVGSYRVTEDPATKIRALSHGRTVHGAESAEPDLAGWALPYHHPHSPVAERFAALRARSKSRASEVDVAVLGLGVGNMAALCDPQWRVLFFEIDALVETLAREHFSFLAACPRCEVEIADGRLGIAASERSFDLIVLDAFNSDAVPVHLLTREAVEGYLAHLADEGEIMVHITNRHVDLRGPLADLAAALGLVATTKGYHPATDPRLGDAARPHVAPTLWVRLRRAPDTAPGWRELLPGEADEVWTDDRASVLSALGQAVPRGPAGRD